MEWEGDMSDPFEKALARSQINITKAEAQVSTIEDEETQALWQTAKKLEISDSQQESKAPQYYSNEEMEQYKEHNSNTLYYSYEETEQDKEHNSNTLQPSFGGKNGKNDRTPHHYSGEETEEGARTLKHYIDENEDSRTMQQYTGKEEETTKALQHIPDEEDNKNSKTHFEYLNEKENTHVKTGVEKECKTLKHYLYENEEGRAMQQCSNEKEEKNNRPQHHCADEEECKAHHPCEEGETEEKTIKQYPYEDKENFRAQHHNPGKEEKKKDRALHDPYEEKVKAVKAMQQCPFEEEEKDHRIQHHCADEEGDGADHPYEEEVKSGKTVLQEQENCRGQHQYPDEDKAGTDLQYPYKEDVNDDKAQYHFSLEEEGKNGITLQHYPNKEEAKDAAAECHYMKEEKENFVRPHHSYPNEEEHQDGRIWQKYTVANVDDEALHDYPYKKEGKDGRTMPHYPHDEDEKNGNRHYHYPCDEKEKSLRAMHPHPDEDEGADGSARQPDSDVKNHVGIEALLHFPYEGGENGGRAEEFYPYEEGYKVERTQQHYPYKDQNKRGRTQRYFNNEEGDGLTLHPDPSEDAEDNRTVEHYGTAETRNVEGLRQHLDTDEEEEHDRRRWENHNNNDKNREKTRRHLTFEGQDSNMHTIDQQSQSQDMAARKGMVGHHWKGPSRGHSFSSRNKWNSGEYDRYGPPRRHQDCPWTHRSHPYHSRGHRIQRHGQQYNPGHYYRNISSNHYSSAMQSESTGNLEDDYVLKPEELAEVLVECHSFHSSFMNLLNYNDFDPKAVQQVAGAHPQLFHLYKNEVWLQPKIKLCQAYTSPQGCPDSLSCHDLHVCHTFVSGWCPEKHCPLGHSLFTNHNKAILEVFCLANLPQHHLKRLLQHNTTTTPPSSSSLDVCRGYNRGRCDMANCQNLHLCLNFLMGRGRCGRPKCTLNHNPNTPGCRRLLSAHGISVNETIMDIIVAVLSANPSLVMTDTTDTAEKQNTQTSRGGADSIKTVTFFDRVKQKLGLYDDSSTRQTVQNDSAQRNRESAAHYKAAKYSPELGAVGGQETTKSDDNYVSQKQDRRHSSSDRNPSGRTEGSQRAVWAHHQQGNTDISEICRFSVESVCLKENKGCSRLHASQPFHWQVRNGERQDSWLNLPGAIITCIETAFCDPAKNGVRLPPLNPAHLRRLEKVLDQDTWYANFEAMVLTNSDYSKVAALRRLCVQDGASAPYIKSRTFSWYFCDVNGRWVKYGQADTTGQANRASSITSADIEAHYLTRSSVPLSFKVSQFTYLINFGAMTQTNQATKVQRAVRRRPELYIDASTQKGHIATRAITSGQKSK